MPWRFRRNGGGLHRLLLMPAAEVLRQGVKGREIVQGCSDRYRGRRVAVVTVYGTLVSTHPADGVKQEIMGLLIERNLVLQVVANELGDGVKRSPIVELVFDSSAPGDTLLAADDLGRADESVIVSSPPVHAQGEGVRHGDVLPHQEVSVFVQESFGFGPHDPPVVPGLALEG